MSFSVRYGLICFLASSFFQSAFSQISTFPYNEDFEIGDGGWTAQNEGDVNGWELGSPAGFDISEAHSGTKAWVTNLDGYYSPNASIYLVSPTFDFTSFSTAPVLLFYINYDMEAGYDFGVVEYSVNGGTDWEVAGSTTSAGINWYTASNGWDGNSGGWVLSAHELTGLAGQPSVLLRIKLTSDGSGIDGEGIGIDNVSIRPSAPDISVADAEQVSDAGLSTSEEVSFIIKAGLQTVSALEISVDVTGPLTYTVTRNFSGLNIAHDSIQTLQVTGLDFSVTGVYDIDITVITPDIVSENNTFSTSVRNFGIVNSFPYIEDFESDRGEWFAQNSDEKGWAYGSPSTPGLNAAHSGNQAWVTNLTGNYGDDGVYMLISPEFDFSSLTTDPFLSFFLYYDTEFCCDSAIVEYSLDKGLSWFILGSNASGGVNWYGAHGWSDYSEDWLQVVHELTGLSGEASVVLRVKMVSNTATASEGFGVDDVFIGYLAPDAGADQVICGVTTANLSAVKPTYGAGRWSVEEGIGGSFNDSLALETVFTGVAGETYTLRWTIMPGGIYPEVNDEVIIVISDVAPPTQAVAGADTIACGPDSTISTALAANIPSQGTGQWSVSGGDDGILISPADPDSQFTGTSGNIYHLRWTITNSVGCMSEDEVVITLSATPEKPVIDVEGAQTGIATLTSTSADSYTWFMNDQPIAGADQALTVTENGLYAVQIRVAGCLSERSDSIFVITTGLDEFNDMRISVFPNPTDDALKVASVSLKEGTTIRIYEGKGILVKEYRVTHDTNEFDMDVSRLTRGFYLVQIIYGNKRLGRKIIKN